MRVRTEKIYPEVPKFHPFKLEFTIETKGEAQAFYNLFNYSPICNVLEEETNISGEDVRETIEHAVKGIDIEDWAEFLEYFDKE